VVQDTRSGAILASANIMRTTWEYEGIALPVGRPEIVASHPEYRNRGLVRAIFELLHARSDGRGDMAQGITGIPYYYRQFGYEFALELEGDRKVALADVPRLKEGAAEPYSLRGMQPDELPFVMALYERDRARGTISTPIDAQFWHWVEDDMTPDSNENWVTQLIVDTTDRPVGYVLRKHMRWGNTLNVLGLAVEPGVSLAAAMPSVLRALKAYAEVMPASRPEAPPASMITFWLGSRHPAYDALGEKLAPRVGHPYAWYVRVRDLPALLRRIAPALERRLEGSIFAGHSGELKIDFYRGGLRLAFEGGRLSAAEQWRAPIWGDEAKAGFPPLVFLQLVFGRRSLAELRHAMPDVWADDEGAAALLEALFPPQRAWVLPQD
jgi:hypothetical protein